VRLSTKLRLCLRQSQLFTIRVPQFEHFLGKALHPGQGGDFSSSPGTSKLLVARARTPNPDGPVRGPYTRKYRTCRGPKPFGRYLARAPNAEEQRRQAPRTWNTGTSTVLGTTKSQQFRNIMLAAGAVSVKSYAPASTLGALNAAV
jgi:hypothetical protein